MKNILILILIFSLNSCIPNKEIISDHSDYENRLEPGKCYFSISEDNKNAEGKPESSFILEIEPNTYEEVDVHYTLADLNFPENVEEVSLITCKHHTKFIFNNKIFKDITSVKNPIGFVYCLVEVPANYKTIYKKDIKPEGVTIKVKRIITHSKITKKRVRKKPKALTSNQLYFESSYWTPLKVANSNNGCGGFAISEIEKALLKLGYNIEINNILDEEDKAALLDFQRKNKLTEGQLSLETLRKLGVIVQ